MLRARPRHPQLGQGRGNLPGWTRTEPSAGGVGPSRSL
jgi:hypothetical protein